MAFECVRDLAQRVRGVRHAAHLVEGLLIALLDIDAATLEATGARLAQPDRVLAVPCDVSDPGRVQAAIDRVAETFGRIDALVDNGTLFSSRIGGAQAFDPETDRIMLCGSPSMLEDLKIMFEERDFIEGSGSKPGHFVIEKAFVER